MGVNRSFGLLNSKYLVNWRVKANKLVVRRLWIRTHIVNRTVLWKVNKSIQSDIFDIIGVTLYTLFCSFRVLVWRFRHEIKQIYLSYFYLQSVYIRNKLHFKTKIKHLIHLCSFLCRAFSVWACLIWASQPFCDPPIVLHLGQAHFLTPPTITITGSSFEEYFSCFIGEARGGILPTSIGNGCWGGGIWVRVVFPFSCLKRFGKSPGPASSTASSNNCHPSATAAWPWVTSLWPAATFLTATMKKNY